MAKIDIADGFYRVWVRVEDVPKLGVALPHTAGHSPLVAFSLALPMGWVESPPYSLAIRPRRSCPDGRTARSEGRRVCG